MIPPTVTGPARLSRRSIGAFVLAAACLLACTIPAVVGFASAGVLDRVFEAPGWLTVTVAAVAMAATVALAIALARRRRTGGRNGC